MASEFMSWRGLILMSDLPATTRHVLLTLGCHMNDAGESCYPSITKLSKETGLSRQTVVAHLQHAKDAGWIEVAKHGYKGKRWARNEYCIAWPKVVNVLDRLDGEGGQPGIHKVVNLLDSNSSRNSSDLDTNVSKETSRQARKPARVSALTLPTWLQPDTWAQFVAHRKAIKSPLTLQAMELAISKLDGLRQQGHDPREVIEQTILNGWKGLFPIKAKQAHGGQRLSENELMRLGDELGLDPRPGESMRDFAARVQSARQGMH